LFKSSVAVAMVRVLQGILAAVVAPAMLYLVASLTRVPFDQSLVILASVSAVLSLLIFQQRQFDSPSLDLDILDLVLNLAFRWLLTLGLLYLLASVTQFDRFYARELIVTWAVASAVVTFAGQIVLVLVLRWVVLKRENVRSAVVLGVNAGSVQLARRLNNEPGYLTQVVGYFDDRSAERLELTGHLPLLGSLRELEDYVRREGIDVIFIALPLRHIARVMALMDRLQDSTVSIYYVPDVYAFDLIQSRSAEIGGVHVIAMYETPFYGYRGVLKRLSDIFFTLCILAIAAPFMVLIAILVKTTSKGPLIFKQRRYGLDGEEILVYKFRSMTVMEDGGQIRQATVGDQRITKVGRYLRQYSLDELPQLINVLQGRMSLVGPRPHAVAHNEMYRRLIKGYMMRHKVRPGITGLAQVSGCRGETAELEQMQARVNYDLDYLRQWSPSLDLRIIIKTLVMMFVDKKAY
jgi:putative colanic acid biosynthesis UDP-glucose lipid carrier transferase